MKTYTKALLTGMAEAFIVGIEIALMFAALALTTGSVFALIACVIATFVHSAWWALALLPCILVMGLLMKAYVWSISR